MACPYSSGPTQWNEFRLSSFTHRERNSAFLHPFPEDLKT